MSLVDKKSLYDRQSRESLGPSVGNDGAGPNPSDGNYYTDSGNINSPFDSGDHLVDLLTKEVLSNNSSVSYKPSPHADTPFADLNGGTGTFSGQTQNPALGQFGGPYKTTGPTDGYY